MTKRQNEERIEGQRIVVHVWRYGKLKMYATHIQSNEQESSQRLLIFAF